MNPARNLIAEAINSGEYFKDAREWYAYKYLYPIKHRYYGLIIGAITLCFALLIMKSALLDDIQLKYPFPIYINDQVHDFSQIRTLAHGQEALPISIARYLASEYVSVREQYHYDDLTKTRWESRLKRTMALSSKKIFSDYIDSVDPAKNPDSPLLRYKANARREIQVKSVKFPKGNRAPELAKIYYQATEY